MRAFDADATQGCAVLTGSEKAFAAGADIKEMQPQSFGKMYGNDYFAGWEYFTATRKPVIAAVAGFALMGGSQRLTRAVGKAKAMEMCLTGRTIGAEEAERAGLVSRVVPAGELLDEALKVATAIAGKAPLAVKAVKEMVDAAFETPLTQGIRFERRLFHGLFGTQDQKEGMAAFVEKRAGQWVGK